MRSGCGDIALMCSDCPIERNPLPYTLDIFLLSFDAVSFVYRSIPSIPRQIRNLRRAQMKNDKCSMICGK
jgi:hypothetical protein